MARAKTPLKAWLILGLAVLLLHLVLLQALPLHLASNSTPHPAATSFATRTVAAEPTATRTPSPAPMPQPSAKPRPRPTAKVAATAPDNPAAAPLKDAESESESESENAVPVPVPLPVAALDQEANVALDVRADSPNAPPSPQPGQQPTPASSPPAPSGDKALDFVASGVPKAIKLIYQVDANKFPYRLSGELLWAPAQDHYVATLSFGAFGQSRRQTSRGLLGPQGLLPERFSDKFRNEVAAHFNRAQGKVTFSANTPDAALLQGAQDRLSVLIQLAAIVTSAPERFTPATTLTIQTIGPRDASLWLFTVGNMETLVLPGGTVQGLKLSRNPRQLYDQQIDIWLAPTLGYLPARIRITEANGDAIDQKWRASEPATSP